MHFLIATHACLYNELEEKVRTCYTSGCHDAYVAMWHFTTLDATLQSKLCLATYENS